MKQATTTPAEYLVKERIAAYKSEYVDGQMLAMASASANHVKLEGDLLLEIETALRRSESKCSTFGSNLKIWIPSSKRFVYPDLSVVCGELETFDEIGDAVLNPILIVEVLSPSTEQYDRTAKFDHYRSIRSLRQYVLVYQTEPRIELFTKSNDRFWLFESFQGLDADVSFSAIDIRLPMSSIYRRITFPLGA